MIKIVYCSKTGFAKQYAEILATETGYEAIDVKNIKSIAKESKIIYVASIMAGSIRGLKKVLKKYDFAAILAVGMYDGKDDYASILKTQNAIDKIPTFYAQGGIDLNKLKGFSKLMMKMIIKSKVKKMSADVLEQKRLVKEESCKNFVKSDNIENLIALAKSL